MYGQKTGLATLWVFFTNSSGHLGEEAEDLKKIYF
jgi:hypothetical protein